MIVGTQVLALGLCAHAYGTYFMGERTPGSTACERASGSSTACCSAALFMLVGVVAGGWILGHAGSTTASARWPTNTSRSSPPRSLIVGIQIFFSSFLLSILGLRRRDG